MSNIGRMIYGYCNGYFGRDSYDDKRIEAEGVDWIVARNEIGKAEFCSFNDEEQKDLLIMEWSIEDKDFN